MIGRTILVLTGALLLAALVVRSAFVDAYVAYDPAKASAVWPSHPSVILASGLAEVGTAAAAAKPVDPATVRRMLGASTRAPLAAEPFLVRGVQAQLAGDSSLAENAFLAARQRDPRSLAARYFLADIYLTLGQTRRGLAEITSLTRLVPQSLSGVAPQLAQFARLPGGATEVRMLLRQQPQLEAWLLNELAANPADVPLALSLWNGRNNAENRPWQQRLVNSLVSAGQYEQARRVWGRFNPSAGPTYELVDSRFEKDAMAPFGWTLSAGPAGVAEPEGGGRLHIIYYGRDDLVLASQLLLLRPGDYRLAMRISGASPSAKSLSWVIRCMPAARDLASIGLGQGKAGTIAAEFTVPAQGCTAQQLDLVGSAPELPEQAELVISEVALSRRPK